MAAQLLRTRTTSRQTAVLLPLVALVRPVAGPALRAEQQPLQPRALRALCSASLLALGRLQEVQPGLPSILQLWQQLCRRQRSQLSLPQQQGRQAAQTRTSLSQTQSLGQPLGLALICRQLRCSGFGSSSRRRRRQGAGPWHPRLSSLRPRSSAPSTSGMQPSSRRSQHGCSRGRRHPAKQQGRRQAATCSSSTSAGSARSQRVGVPGWRQSWMRRRPPTRRPQLPGRQQGQGPAAASNRCSMQRQEQQGRSHHWTLRMRQGHSAPCCRHGSLWQQPMSHARCAQSASTMQQGQQTWRPQQALQQRSPQQRRHSTL